MEWGHKGRRTDPSTGAEGWENPCGGFPGVGHKVHHLPKRQEGGGAGHHGGSSWTEDRAQNASQEGEEEEEHNWGGAQLKLFIEVMIHLYLEAPGGISFQSR